MRWNDRTSRSAAAGLTFEGDVRLMKLTEVSLTYRFHGSEYLSPPAQIDWAINELGVRLKAQSITLTPYDGGAAASDAPITLHFVLGPAPEAVDSANVAGVLLPTRPESLAVFSVTSSAATSVFVYGADIRGLVYAITELADRVRHTSDPLAALLQSLPLVESPTARIRSISKCFQSAEEDLGWFHDRDGWRDYLTHMATHRFNRISLTLGMQYNYPYGNEFISDVYFYFAYPFLVSVPGHDVTAEGLSKTERERNLQTLKFIAREAHLRGLEFTLALWTQSYDFDDCPNTNYPITGVTEENRAAYCRDALALILSEVPEITGLTLRVHVESGIPEGRYEFWRTYFEAVAGCGRAISVDLHAKGIDPVLIEIAQSTGMPVTISPKYTSEHMGLPYHQASIRALELPSSRARSGKEGVGRDSESLYSGADAERYAGAWKFSEGERKFMRYSYGDLLHEHRSYDIVYRIWPGTTRVLMWGDPKLSGGYGRHSTFCGSSGVELCEPLSFKGRMGTGIGGNRTGYRDETLVCAHDWEKFSYTYRVWGRCLYNPDTDADVWGRYLRWAFGAASKSCEAAMSNASRILPLITLAHTPTSSNNSYWPELYENMSIVQEAPRLPYGYELFLPARFGTVGSCDPQLFMSPADFATDIATGNPVRKIAPLTWANWLDRLATAAATETAAARALTPDPSPEFRRFTVDAAILAAIGRFFAEKTRAAVLWELHLLTEDSDTARQALEHYRAARDAWAIAAEESREVYLPDLTYGPHSWLRGCWSDRLPAIDHDINEMRLMIEAGSTTRAGTGVDAGLVERVLGWSASQHINGRHEPPASFRRGSDIDLTCTPEQTDAKHGWLHYRRVDQSLAWQSQKLSSENGQFHAAIPAAYTDADYPLQYYFEFDTGDHSAFFPSIGSDLSDQPYFIVRSAIGRQ